MSCLVVVVQTLIDSPGRETVPYYGSNLGYIGPYHDHHPESRDYSYRCGWTEMTRVEGALLVDQECEVLG